eukprot:gnl/MRDRNA2_/MRDRNA2_19563_c0_seq2.p1 gnl/MRDRNA2_/MRDRNA2_19563_c0~~gnl/MRDRNA2_/MRDRNA2_19563_c0_seq2.p1  ORF type:complete len:195 (+),score=28.42 gnl/MRDRNA2_/MRDRNA2_19563_c0_seq2:109-693(+)
MFLPKSLIVAGIAIWIVCVVPPPGTGAKFVEAVAKAHRGSLLTSVQLSLKTYSLITYEVVLQIWHGMTQGPLKPPPHKDMTGQLCVVTGTTAGIGVETADQLSRWGCRVIMANRNVRKSQQVADQIISKGNRPNSVPLESWALDLADLDSVNMFVKRFADSQLPKISVLVNNAGMIPSSEAWRSHCSCHLSVAP